MEPGPCFVYVSSKIDALNLEVVSKPEVGSRKSEVGSQKSEVRSQTSLVPRQLSYPREVDTSTKRKT